MKKIIFVLLFPLHLFAQKFSAYEINRWEKQAKQVTIIRDNWGIPHVYGKTNADCVFGLLYAQCEDDFKRVEMNYVEKLGRMAEVKGTSEIYNDLLIRLIIDSADAVNDYNDAEPWLKKLLNAFADGINYYLYKHKEMKPALLHRFEPWYPLLWTDGSIGAINTADVTVEELEKFYSGTHTSTGFHKKETEPELTGSNGFAFAPSITASHHSILYINPHVTFYFRPEVQMVSEEGMNVYGAVTWGQFFVYQGFNEHCGWMHTSSYVDIADLYAEKITEKGGKYFYEYEGVVKPVTEKKITLHFKEGSLMKTKTINAFYTPHGPVMAKRNGAWLSLKANNRSMNGLVQSWKRTQSKSFSDFKKIMDIKANTSNNTVYADAEGNIAYWHGNFMPERNTKFDWTKPVDGTIAATEWKGLHTVDETVHIINPSNGWLQNCNSTPFTAAGNMSPKKENYPAYMAPDGENFRSINAVRVLSKESNYTIDKVIAAGYDTYLAAFEKLIPALVKAFDANKEKYVSLTEPVLTLKNWDIRAAENSVATALAITWGEKLLPGILHAAEDYEDIDQVTRTEKFAATAPAEDLLQPLSDVIDEFKTKYGKWQTAWGEINRYQRISTDIDQEYNDAAPSIPVGFASSAWGQLPSYTSRYFPGTSKRYGVNGNSFICAVEFGERITAKSLLAGGETGNPDSKHFNDQMLMYSKGQFKDVLFYKEDVMKHAERTYHPGE